MNHPLINQFEIKNRPLVLDGAIGTYLIEKGIIPDNSIWTTEANISKYEMVVEIHKEYIANGAEIITTNTFSSNPHAVHLNKNMRKSQILVKKAVQAAIQAREESGIENILIAGSNSPAEDCYQYERTISEIELKRNHQTHIELLWSNGVDFILNETQGHLDEISIICDICEKMAIPYVISLYFDENANLLSGENINSVIEYINLKYPNAIIGINCVNPKLFEFIDKSQLEKINWGFHFNSAHSNHNDEEISCYISPQEYLEFALNAINENTIYVGSCCGSNPNHTNVLRQYFDKNL